MPSRSVSYLDPVQYVKGVGPRRAEVLESAGIHTAIDLLRYYPRRWLDRSTVKPFSELREGDKVTSIGKVVSHGILKGRRRIFEVLLSDGDSYLTLTWFKGHRYLEKRFKRDDVLAVSGTVTHFNGPQLIHPEFEFLSDEDDIDNLTHSGRIIPLYPSTAELKACGLDSRRFRTIIRNALDKYASDIEDYLPVKLVKELRLMPLDRSIGEIHFPESGAMMEAARERLAFDELFLLELKLALAKASGDRKRKRHTYRPPSDMIRDYYDRLPFNLTKSQDKAVGEIMEDMLKPAPMHRLLMGEVGSGKTVVAMSAMLLAVENGYQAAIMVPTELLAEQHYQSISKYNQSLNLRTALLTGSLDPKSRRCVAQGVAAGEYDIIVGTHALFTEGIEFKNLALAVIDEQHRFGVNQRLRFRQKGSRTDLLVMTATPIPRSLALTAYGDLNLSVISELPPGRIPIKTAWRTDSSRMKVYDFIRDECSHGRQAFVVFPLVEDSEKLDLKSAVSAYEHLRAEVFPDLRLGLVHGRMSFEERDEVSRKFRDGDFNILVTTTVIEVGIDIPNASIILVENAERFGLSQLHQLRGRIGRGKHKSYCILMSSDDPGDIAKERLAAIESTNDGFEIAEVDLKLRGPGEFLGMKQHGLPDFRIADLVRDARLLEVAKKCAFDIVDKKYTLTVDDMKRLKEEASWLYGKASEFLTSG